MATIEELKAFEANTIWIGEQYQELRRLYPDEWVAAYNGEVIGHHKDYETLLKDLRERYPGHYKQIATDFISTEDVQLIL